MASCKIQESKRKARRSMIDSSPSSLASPCNKVAVALLRTVLLVAYSFHEAGCRSVSGLMLLLLPTSSISLVTALVSSWLAQTRLAVLKQHVRLGGSINSLTQAINW